MHPATDSVCNKLDLKNGCILQLLNPYLQIFFPRYPMEEYIDYYNNRRYQRKLMTLAPMEVHEIFLAA